ncbi:DUF6798 domain-containing protein [Planctomyces sp. SH-PL62]|uniref:DUF6798 domain-containing protein n=1 Tax=Planctomyces sp. SH-PL62 TaxID=1636152 RepID=UPI00078BEC6D|nr:DUF6798 domain-containing protein [Planctomyces sp. SH-PL62]AMV36877.1 hypothetical protein VT85_05565 [Planctomyces sp. SH-PL62]
MALGLGIEERRGSEAAPWGFVLLVLGLYLTLKGYHSLDGDQAHRLPLLLHSLDPRVFADDPFVRSFDAFNPHRGALGLIGGLSQVVGLSAALALLFAATFVVSVRGFHRLAVAACPGGGSAVGWVAVALFLAAKAGNIGTNHLFEAMLLDRLTALALGWLATAAAVEDPRKGWAASALAIGAAAWVHPSMGLQLALIFAGSWGAWALFRGRTGTSWRLAIGASLATGLAIVPGLVANLAPFGNLHEGLPPETFRLLTVELQSPQHMLPHLWREPQWLAAGAYLALAVLALLASSGRRDQDAEPTRPDPARLRLVLMLGVVLVWLAASWVAVEMIRHVGATVFQPFRVATFGRGLCLIFVSGRVVALWRRGDWSGRLRAILIPVGCTGDWLFVTVAGIEVVMTLLESAGERLGGRVRTVVLLGLLAWAGTFLANHDTERGERTLAGAAAVGIVVGLIGDRSMGFSGGWTPRRFRLATAAAWALPAAALVAGLVPTDHRWSDLKVVRGLVARCRFAPRPINDIERLAVWCRENTPSSARFVGPPGPKGFRLWSQRDWAFNRAGSPYHAEGLRDWYERFRDHVDFDGTPEAFVRAYLDGRHRLEARYDAMSDDRLAALAVRQGADYVVAASDRAESPPRGVLERLHAQGAYAVYRVRSERLAQIQR